MNSIIHRYVVVFCMLIIGIFNPIFAQKNDSIKVKTLKGVVVTENIKEKQMRSTSPLQLMDGDKLKQMGALMVSDAVKFFSGVSVKDYGGIGGLKTVSVRSLGANHTAVALDGIAISNTQTGQIDLGKLSLDNVGQMTLNVGQDDNMLQPALLFASANVLNIKSISPRWTGKSSNLSIGVKEGSLGFINPSARIENRWSSKLASIVNVDYLSAKGNYWYTQNNDQATIKLRRENSDIESFKTELNLYRKLYKNDELNIKAYYFSSERGLPTNLLYNKRATERLTDRNIFVQGNYKKAWGSKLDLLANAKYNFAYNKYSCPDEAIYSAPTEFNYYQREYYLSATLLYRFTPSLSIALANDAFVNNMSSDLRDFAYPTRLTILNALACKYINSRLTATTNILSTCTNESVKYRLPADNQKQLSPSASLSYQILPQENLRVRLLYKSTFRLPTFNDLYYATMGSRDLKPEKAKELNTGVTWTRKMIGTLSSFTISVDGFYNQIDQKIVAVPSQNMFVWSMKNVGKVDIKGIETNLSTCFRLCKKVELTADLNFTYQQALDKTSKYEMPDKLTYNNQIAYTPTNTGSARIGLTSPWVNISYSVLSSGERYSSANNLSQYKMKGYTDHSLSAWRTFNLKNIRFNLQGEVLNLLNSEYEIVKLYPMPSRQFRASIKLYI